MKAREIRKRLRAEQHHEKQAYINKIDKAFERLSEGCSNRVLKAVSAPSVRDSEHSGAMCLPDVAIYSAGYRKSKDIVTAR